MINWNPCFKPLITVFTCILIIKSQLTGAVIMTCYAKINEPSPEDISPDLCTHLIVIGNTTIDFNGAFAFPDPAIMQRYNVLKSKNQDLKILISLTPNNTRMSLLAINQTRIDQVAVQTYLYLLQNQLDGFDFDWEFPVWSSDAQYTDKDGFTQILKTFRNMFDKARYKLLLTAAVVAMYNIADIGYNAQDLNTYLDYIQVMNYDFHFYSLWRPFTGFNAPLHKAPYEAFWFNNINSVSLFLLTLTALQEYSTQHWLDLGISAKKLVFGIPVYAIGYKLWNKTLHDVYSPAVGYSKYGSVISYDNICRYLRMKQFKYHWDDYAKTPYVVNGRQWLAVEDKQSVEAKTQFAQDMGVAGVMVFALNSDDYLGKCGEGKYPLITTIRNTLTIRNQTRSSSRNFF